MRIFKVLATVALALTLRGSASAQFAVVATSGTQTINGTKTFADRLKVTGVTLFGSSGQSMFDLAGNLLISGWAALSSGITASSGTFTATGATQYSLQTSSGASIGGGLVASWIAAVLDGSHIRTASIDTTKLVLGSVDTNRLGNDAATTPKILDGAVTTPKIAANAVDTTKIQTGAVDTNRLTPTGVSAGTYSSPASVSVDTSGRVTAISAGTAGATLISSSTLVLGGSTTQSTFNIAYATVTPASNWSGTHPVKCEVSIALKTSVTFNVVRVGVLVNGQWVAPQTSALGGVGAYPVPALYTQMGGFIVFPAGSVTGSASMALTISTDPGETATWTNANGWTTFSCAELP